jgi:hypothetical protein
LRIAGVNVDVGRQRESPMILGPSICSSK